jgi:hypothetical protein
MLVEERDEVLLYVMLGHLQVINRRPSAKLVRRRVQGNDDGFVRPFLHSYPSHKQADQTFQVLST